jgi:capsid protein
VDIGRNAAALLAELDAGVRTYEDVYAELGLDWKQAFRQRAVERKFVKELAVEFGLQPDEIVKASNAELVAAQQQQQQPATQPPE